MLENNHTIHLTLNGESRAFTVEPQETLLHVLCERAHLTGARSTRAVCSPSRRTAVRSRPSRASAPPTSRTRCSRRLSTPEPSSAATARPGMIMAAKALLDRDPHPTREEIHAAMSGNLCRCTGYTKIEEAIVAASRVIEQYANGKEVQQ